MTRRARLAAVPWLVLFAPLATASSAEAPDYARDIAPLFERHCVECHGPKKQESLLRLDSRKETLAGGMSGDAVLPGRSRDSLLLKHLRGEARPPMPYKKPPLDPAEVDRIAAWIDAGAPGGSDEPLPSHEPAKAVHWAYAKPVRPPIPAVTRGDWVRSPIDAFVLARLEKEGLSPSPEADRETLARRLSLDLVGLPPSPAEVDAFLADASPDAYEKLVDRLLASPRYGERWARPWLDLARYADTNGYEKDQGRVAWRWRDWVIDALNRDLSFRDFTVQQLAGDMLPGATDEQRIATGFHRNSLLNQEGGIDVEEARFEVLVDRVNTTAAVWLGSTMACAQCHNHKFDPFPQRDYYRLMAFFDNGEYTVHGAGEETVLDRWIVEPELEIGPVEVLARRAALRGEAEGLERERRTRPLEAELAAFEAQIAGSEARFAALVPRKAAAKSGAALVKQADASLLAGGALDPTDVYTVALRAPRGATAFRIEALPDPSLPKQGPGRAPTGGFSITGLEASAGGRPLALARAFADGADPGRPAARILDGQAATGWGASDEAEAGRRRWVTVALATPLASRDVTLVLKFESGTKESPSTLGRFRVLATTSDRPFAGLPVPAEIRPILDTASEARTADQRAALERWFRPQAPSLDPVRDRLAAIRDALEKEAVGTAPVLRERPGYEKPSTLVRERGSFTSPGERVWAAVPSALGTLAEDQPANRLGLARWLVSPDNPLTARVTVNRLWQTVFGRGLVATAEDFGTQGERPTHPELLDWLAVELVENGWSQKRLLRTIVTSATYRQSSTAAPERRERDPDDRLLSRGARYRVEAEMVRDIALAAAGLLSPKIGGPSVFPEQPDGVWNVPYSSMKWTTSPNEDRHRRSLYTFIRRSSPYPSLVAFDAPSREACTVRRVMSNTPLQALTTLNDPVFSEAARALAARATAEGGATVPERIVYAYRLCTARRPSPPDLEALVAFHDREKARFDAAPERARALLEAPSAAPGDGGRAALTMVANVLLSMDATLTRE
jgi:mono/diheme cytochrome c family protein